MIRSRIADIDGLAGVVRDLTGAAAEVRPGAGHVVVDQAERLAQRMRERTPVGATGRTRGSVTSDQDWTEDGNGIYAEAGHEWFVARFVDQGTATMAPRPIAEPALAETLPEFEAALGRLHDDLLR